MYETTVTSESFSSANKLQGKKENEKAIYNGEENSMPTG